MIRIKQLRNFSTKCSQTCVLNLDQSAFGIDGIDAIPGFGNFDTIRRSCVELFEFSVERRLHGLIRIV
jgi:hypothetical protein